MTKKIVIIGASEMGTKLAYALAAKVSQEAIRLKIILYNRTIDLASGEVIDLQNAITANGWDNISVKASNKRTSFKEADIVAVTAGASWATLQTGNRDAELPFTTDIAINYGKMMRKQCPQAFVMVVTNPVDIVTWLIKEHAMFPANKVIGIGVACDTVRYQEAIRNQLRKEGIYGKKVESLVIGSHNGSDMVMVASGVTVNKKPISTLVSSGKLTEDQLAEILENAEKETNSKGFSIAQSKRGRTSSTGPAEIMASISIAYLFNRPLLLPVSRFIEDEDHSKYDISNVCTGVLTQIDASGSKIEGVEMKASERSKFSTVAQEVKSTKKEIGDGKLLQSLGLAMNALLHKYQQKLAHHEETLQRNEKVLDQTLAQLDVIGRKYDSAVKGEAKGHSIPHSSSPTTSRQFSTVAYERTKGNEPKPASFIPDVKPMQRRPVVGSIPHTCVSEVSNVTKMRPVVNFLLKNIR